MKAIICFAAIIVFAVAYPTQEGQAYTNEAIRQAQSSHLIPQNAQIQKVEEGIELGALENIPGNQRVDLFQLLGSQFPLEVDQNSHLKLFKIFNVKSIQLAAAKFVAKSVNKIA